LRKESHAEARSPRLEWLSVSNYCLWLDKSFGSEVLQSLVRPRSVILTPIGPREPAHEMSSMPLTIFAGIELVGAGFSGSARFGQELPTIRLEDLPY
jgi:hypothetical protein